MEVMNMKTDNELRIQITDALGHICMDRMIRGEGHVLTLDVSRLKAGVYFYRVYNAEIELLEGKWKNLIIYNTLVLAFLLMAGGVKMHGQEMTDINQISAYLALTACNESFSEAFFSHYEEIQKVDNLIVDISYNIGGYSSFCDTVLGYLVDNDTIYIDNKDASSGFSPDYKLDLFELFQKKSRKKLLGRLEGIIQEL